MRDYIGDYYKGMNKDHTRSLDYGSHSRLFEIPFPSGFSHTKNKTQTQTAQPASQTTPNHKPQLPNYQSLARRSPLNFQSQLLVH